MADRAVRSANTGTSKFQLGMSSFGAKEQQQFGHSIRLAMACIEGTQAAPRAETMPSMPTDTVSIRQRLSALSQNITSHHADLLELLVRFDDVKGWEAGGAKHCVAWMDLELGIGRKLGWEYLKVGRELRELPTTTALFRAGKLSWSKVRAIARVASKESEKLLCHAALDASVSDVARLCRDYQWDKDNDGSKSDDERARSQWNSRSLTWKQTSNGSTCIQLTLPPEIAQAFISSVEHSRNLLNEPNSNTELKSHSSASSALSASTASPASSDRDEPNTVDATDKITKADKSDISLAALRADAAVLMAETSLQADDRDIAAADRYQVIVSVEQDDLVKGSNLDKNNVAQNHVKPMDSNDLKNCDDLIDCNGLINNADQANGLNFARTDKRNPYVRKNRSEKFQTPVKRPTVRHAGPIGRETARRIACDCSVTTNIISHGDPVSIGRKSRLWPAAMARAIKARDQHCQFYGCTQTRNLQIHHIKHWADGGTTSIDNGVCLCQACHTKVHEGGLEIQRVNCSEKRLDEQFERQRYSKSRHFDPQYSGKQHPSKQHSNQQLDQPESSLRNGDANSAVRNATIIEQQLRDNRESFNQVRALLPTTHRFRIINAQGLDIRDNYNFKPDSILLKHASATNTDSRKNDSTHTDSTHIDSTHIDSTHIGSTHADSTLINSSHTGPTHTNSTHTDDLTADPASLTSPTDIMKHAWTIKEQAGIYQAQTRIH